MDRFGGGAAYGGGGGGLYGVYGAGPDGGGIGSCPVPAGHGRGSLAIPAALWYDGGKETKEDPYGYQLSAPGSLFPADEDRGGGRDRKVLSGDGRLPRKPSGDRKAGGRDEGGGGYPAAGRDPLRRKVHLLSGPVGASPETEPVKEKNGACPVLLFYNHSF